MVAMKQLSGKKSFENGSKLENRTHLSSLNSFCSRRILCWLNEEGETELESSVRKVCLFPTRSVISLINCKPPHG